MKRFFSILTVMAILASTSGCANGPIRNFFSGAACNSCNPPFGRLFQRSPNTVGTCASGTCGGVAPIDGSLTGGETFGSGYYNGSGTMAPIPGATGDTYPYPGTGDAGLSGYVNPPTGIAPSNSIGN